MLFISSAAGDSLLVNNDAGKHLYRIARVGQIVYLITDADSLRITFNDTRHLVSVNKDQYQLFPAYYKQLKQALSTNHSVMAALRLLEDNIGDYPIGDALPLLWFEPQMGKRIQKAMIRTQRSQAEMTDTWVCAYHYNANGKLAGVRAADGQLIRFTKQVVYKNQHVYTVQFYRNIEDRQVTETALIYKPDQLYWHDEVLETGKNRTTKSEGIIKRNYP